MPRLVGTKIRYDYCGSDADATSFINYDLSMKGTCSDLSIGDDTQTYYYRFGCAGREEFAGKFIDRPLYT